MMVIDLKPEHKLQVCLKLDLRWRKIIMLDTSSVDTFADIFT